MRSKKHRDPRQGTYAIIAGPLVYVGSTAGGPGRGFGARLEEHLRALAKGAHPNGALTCQYTIDGGRGWRMLPLSVVRCGDIAGARLVEGIVIRALGKSLCNERR